MFLRQFVGLGLHKSSCILFSCLFFVSCTTVSSKPTEVVSNAGSRKIASASAAAMAVNSSAFLAKQACPVLASIQSRIPSWRDASGRSERRELTSRYNAEYVMNMLQETDSQGRTLHQRLMLELSSDSDCLSRIGDLRENICFYREYSEACEALHEIDKLKGETIIQEFEEFAGASIESIDPSQLAYKIDEFIENRRSSSDTITKVWASVAGVAVVAGAVTGGVAAAIAEDAVTAKLVARNTTARVVVAAGVAAGVATAIGVVAGVTLLILAIQYGVSSHHEKKVKNRRRPRRE